MAAPPRQSTNFFREKVNRAISVVNPLSNRLNGIATSRTGKPAHVNTGTYIIPPPSPSIENKKEVAKKIIAINGISKLYSEYVVALFIMVFFGTWHIGKVQRFSF